MAIASRVSTTAHPIANSKRRMPARQRRELTWGFIFISPWLIGFLCFQLLPILFTIFLSFTDYKGTSQFQWGAFNFVGLKNYAHLFEDTNFLPSMGVTIKFALISIPLGLVVPLLFALLVNSKNLIAPSLFRTLIFLPAIIPVVAGTIIFNGVLNSQSGWINLSLKALGIADPPRWFADPFWAGFALNLLALWSLGNAMIILLAGLQNVPTELYEAATIDGANFMDRFFKITIPMISPIIFYNVTIGVILAFQYFVPALLIGQRNGDPQGSLLFFPLHFYLQAFVYSDMGYASVLALVIFVVSMSAAMLLFFFGQRLVYYAGSEQ